MATTREGAGMTEPRIAVVQEIKAPVRWQDIEQEAQGFRDGFVDLFLKYRGAPLLADTGESLKDGAGREARVTQGSFCAHFGIATSTFADWLNRRGDVSGSRTYTRLPKEYMGSVQQVLGGKGIFHNLWYDLAKQPEESYPPYAEETIVLANNHTTDTKGWQRLARASSAICFVRGRIRFLTPEGTLGGSPTSGSIFHYFGQRADKFAEIFGAFGKIGRVVASS